MLRHDGQVQPLPAGFRAGAIPIIRGALGSNRRSLHGLLSDPSVVALDAPREWGEQTWTNVNTPDDLRALHPRRGPGEPS
jgi:molybdopterin-guanine dinucleotide biosynthesis protein A